MMAGKEAFGEEKFLATYRQENARLAAEVIAVGQRKWCRDQREFIEGIGAARDVFLDNQHSISENDITTALSYFVVAGNSCDFKPSDVLLAPVLERYGFKLEDFMPDGRLDSIMNAKILNTQELLSRHEQSCGNLIDVIRKTLPELTRKPLCSSLFLSAHPQWERCRCSRLPP